MSWWDSSALVALLTEEAATRSVEKIMASDRETAVWWGARVEATSAISRVQRAGGVPARDAAALLADLDALLAEAPEVPPSEEVRTTACRLLRRHALTAADALQLAAALVWVEYRPEGAGFVCLDRRLCEAAAREGFSVLPELE